MRWGRRGRFILLALLLTLFPSRGSAQIFITNLNRITVLTPGILSVKTNAPAGQSFTAVTNAIGWVDFLLDDANPSNGAPASLHVNLREYVEAGKFEPVPGAVTGALLASSYSVTLTNGHLTGARTNETRFIFPTNITLVVSNKYWWELISDAGDDVHAHYYHLSFQDGDVIMGGIKSPNDPNSVSDMAFNEGTISRYPEVVNALLLTNGTRVDLRLEFRHNGTPSVLEVSSNLVTWIPLLTNVAPPSPYILIPGITEPGAPPRQYFRGRYLNVR